MYIYDVDQWGIIIAYISPDSDECCVYTCSPPTLETNVDEQPIHPITAESRH